MVLEYHPSPRLPRGDTCRQRTIPWSTKSNALVRERYLPGCRMSIQTHAFFLASSWYFKDGFTIALFLLSVYRSACFTSMPLRMTRYASHTVLELSCDSTYNQQKAYMEELKIISPPRPWCTCASMSRSSRQREVTFNRPRAGDWQRFPSSCLPDGKEDMYDGFERVFPLDCCPVDYGQISLMCISTPPPTYTYR